MSEHLLVGLAAILVLGVAAQWLAWRLRLPSILILLTTGFLAGPVTGFLNPDELFGSLLFPVVSLSVAIIMFEGALGLKIADLGAHGAVLRNLISMGALVTWVLSAVAAHFILGFAWPLAVLLGAILIVTGPTVIGPLLRHVRPVGPVGPILRWEGILIDPVGATLALLVFEFVLAAGPREGSAIALAGLARTLVVGGVTGALGAGLLYVVLRRYWVPDYLQNPVALMMVVGVFALSNHFQHESGLLAVTVMGVALANQKHVPVKHLIEFKESVGLLLLAGLFILLAARLRLSDLTQLGLETVLFIVFLILIVRPLSIAVSTAGSALERRERAFMAFMAPRGVVAAAVTSIFALRLSNAGFAEADRLGPTMFAIIIATVALYGLTSLPLARRLGLSPLSTPQGVLFAGAHDWAQAIALELQAQGFDVLLVDTNAAKLRGAALAGLPTYYGSILADDSAEQIDTGGLGRLLAMTSNDEVNSLAALHFVETFGRREVYQLPLRSKRAEPEREIPGHLHGRFLFSPNATFGTLQQRFEHGAVVKTTPLTKQFDYAAYRALYQDRAQPLFIIDQESGKLTVITTDNSVAPQPGQQIVSLVAPEVAVADHEPDPVEVSLAHE